VYVEYHVTTRITCTNYNERQSTGLMVGVWGRVDLLRGTIYYIPITTSDVILTKSSATAEIARDA